MVFFSCNNCGEACKKNQVERHLFQCRNTTFSCIDCQLIYTRETYKDHVKCITENQKYGGKNYVEKENKGEVKQNAWVDQVNGAIENVTDHQVKELLKSVAGFANIPRKEAKFINFLTNSCRLRDKNLALRAWQAIAAEAEKMRLEAIRKQEEMQKKERAQKEAAKVSVKTTESSSVTEETVKKESTEVPSFKWKKSIKRKLKEAGGEMKIKKLRKAVIEEFSTKYPDDDSDSLAAIFDEKLEKSGVAVDGKMVSLVAA
uniref:Zf-LYAR domain-containing protein n=1 Tax=Caenorhabditis tropicalis TaxID=1561998 RepID=A0A1I7TT48_9PELO